MKCGVSSIPAVCRKTVSSGGTEISRSIGRNSTAIGLFVLLCTAISDMDIRPLSQSWKVVCVTADLLLLEQEYALFVCDRDVDFAVAVDVGHLELGADARVVVNLVRRPFGLAVLDRQFEP